MVGGAQKDFDFAAPLFAAMGKTIVLQGGPGTGQLCKLANQIGIASGMIAMSEALAFAHATGLNLETTLRSISGGGAASWALLNLAPRVLKGVDWALLATIALMFVVHVYGAVKRIQPITETLEIGFWMILLVLNTLFYPATSITL